MLNLWDPIGVHPGDDGPVDEYDCLRDLVLSGLARGEDADALESLLRLELTDHFGLSASAVDRQVVTGIVEWWNVRS